MSKIFFNQKIVNVWSEKDREEFRSKSNLPILKSKNDFINRLKNELIVVVIAETGSGKTTQLPQYMADEFEKEGGIIVVTQPRALAAISIAERVGYEYDGPEIGKAGHSVGFKVGRDSTQSNTNRIIFMTDAQLIKEMMNDNFLSNVRGLLIDEAHERSVNTDIVLGIANYLLKNRKDKFYVVVASATIDPKTFLRFFEKENNKPLEVPGRVYPVSLHYWPEIIPKEQENDEEDHTDKIIKKATLSTKFVVEKVIEAVQKFDKGHTLVFLPGQKDCEKCVQMFSELAPKNFEALPLFGSLSSEEQKKVLEFERNKPMGKDRLVAFCTNVAEASLTVEGVKIVMDSGLSKESRYDMNRRANVLEMSWISKSSANQRKGRAGRTSEGTCIRLFLEPSLTRESIEPEILRSSIDQILLQLKILKLEDLPLITRPDKDKWDLALENLKFVGALDPFSKVTSLGKLFSTLPFDPVISAFLTDLYLNHKTDIGIKTAALVTAPGELFYLGNKETRNEDEKEIALKAAKFESDVIFKISIYDQWNESGNVSSKLENGAYECPKCKLELKYPKCKNCQMKFTIDTKLNNTVLKYMNKTFNEVENTLNQYNSKSVEEFLRSDLMCHEDDEDVNKCLSKALSNWMFEQAGHTIVPNIPAIGLRIISSDEKCNASSTSCFFNNKSTLNENQFFVSVSPFFRIKKPPSEDLIFAKNIHPVDINHLKMSRNSKRVCISKNSKIELAFKKDNVGPIMANYKINNSEKKLRFHDWLKEYFDEESRFCPSIYNKKNCQLSIYCPSHLSLRVKSLALGIFDKIKRDLIDHEYKKPFSILNGSFFIFLNNGFSCSRIIANSDDIRFMVGNLPYNDWKEFSEDFFKKFNIREDIISSDYNVKDKQVVLVFKDNRTANYHKLKFQGQIVTGDSRSETRENNKINYTLVCSSNKINPEVHDLSSTFRVKIKTWKKISSNYSIKINKLPNDFTLPNWIPKPDNSDLKINTQTKVERGSATLFLNYSEHHDAITAHNNLTLYKNHLSYQSRIVGSRTVNIEPVIDNLSTYVKWETEFENLEDAEKIFQHRNVFTDIKINSSSFDMKRIPEGYFPKKDLDDIIRKIEESCEGSTCKYSLTEDSTKVKFETKNVSPSLIEEFKKNINSLFEPIILSLPPKTDSTRRFYFNKLFERRDFLENLAAKYNVLIQHESSVLKVFGDQIDLGNFMFQIGEDYEDFLNRYVEICLEPEASILFEKNRIGAAKLEQLKNKYMSIEINYGDKVITIYSSKRVNNLKQIEEEIKSLLKGISVSGDYTSNDQCIHCGDQSSLVKLSICGHFSCNECLKSLSKSSKIFPILCKACKCVIHIDDFLNQITKNDQDTLVKHSVEFYLQNNQETIGIKFCPLNCDGLINENNGYAKCPTCKKYVCGKCGSIDSFHENRSCLDFRKFLKRFDIKDLISHGKNWVNQNWNNKLPEIIQTTINPHLENHGLPFLKLFELGIKSLGVIDVLKSGFFAWHGTSESALDPICQNGFDPQRRSGQVHGPGEYFGVTPNVSLSYCKGGNFMLVAFILNGPHVSYKINFCHVIANPTDNSLTYCLPLLIVNFGAKKTIGFEYKPTVFSNIKSFDIGDTLKHRYICFYWKQDNGEFEPYGQNSNEKLENQYMKYIESKIKDNKRVLINLVRYNDDLPQNYIINFEKMIQKNAKTGYRRRIERRAVDLQNCYGNNWEFEINQGKWQKFDVLWQGHLEMNFKRYLNGLHHHRFQMNLAPRPETYEINYVNMTERNTKSETIRNIRRTS